MEKNKPKISIVIATCNSGWILERTLQSIKNQNYPKDCIEIIVADNMSKDNTRDIAERYGARVLVITGNSPQVCVQRNAGANNAIGDYVYMLDHDMALSKNLLRNFSDKVATNKNFVDAYYVPEKIVGNSKFWSVLRTYERSFYNSTVIDAARIIKRDVFNKIQYDIVLSNGPADWDFDIQLKKIGCKFDIIDESEYVEHQEQYLSLWKYLFKKVNYIQGGTKYQNKWKNKGYIYSSIIKKQYGLFYRLIGVFVEKGKYKKILKKFYLFIPMLSLRVLVGTFYIFKK